MKALRIHELTGVEALVYEDTEPPVVSKGQVVIDVKAAAAGFPDLLLCEGKYQFKPAPPFSPGSELSGTVRAVGEGVDRFAVGDAVIGMGICGGFAEQVMLPAERVMAKPEGVSFEVAAATMSAYGTVMHAFEDRARLQPGETVLVLGASGGVGAAAIDLAKHMGAKVIAAASTDEKLAVCRELGADETINYATEDLKKRAKALSGGGCDVIFDPVGGAFTEAAFRATAWNGRHLVVGFAAGEIPSLPINLALLKGASLVGVFWGSFLAREPLRGAEQLARIGRWVAEGKLSPLVSATYPLAEGREALKKMAAREITGRVVLVP